MKLIIDIPEDDYRHIKEYYEKNDIVEATYSYIYYGIPLNEQEPREDCISRKDVIKTILDSSKNFKNEFDRGFFIDKINALPSVIPKEPINHELFRKALKHRLYERYMDNPAEFKALCGLIDDVESVIKHNAEVLARIESEE